MDAPSTTRIDDVQADATLLDASFARVARTTSTQEVCDARVLLPLPDGDVLAFDLKHDPSAPSVTLDVDPLVAGNDFRVIHESDHVLAARLSIAASRRLASGPESDRIFVILRGDGLAFWQNEETHRISPRSVVHAPAGEPVRLWAQGPDDMLAVVLQPRTAAPAKRRTLADEIARRREERPSS